MVGKNKLIRQMGNARFHITCSCFTLEKYRLTCKVIRVKRERIFEEKKFTPALRCAARGSIGARGWWKNGKRVD